MRNARLVLALLLTICFTAAAVHENLAAVNARKPSSSEAGVLATLMGDSRRLFANHFFVKADAYFHSGYYPSIFDRSAPKERSHLQAAAEEQEDHHQDHKEAGASNHENEEEEGFLGKPLDWIEAFGRNFFVSHHSHLEAGNERELLPWMKLSADLDPQKIETYTVSSFWLRTRLGKPNEAEQFLREGLRANPDSYEILFELGRIQEENRHDVERARTLYELALEKWNKQKQGGGTPDDFVFEQITVFLARLEERAGNVAKAISYLEKAKEVSPARDALEKRIAELREKLNSPAPASKN